MSAAISSGQLRDEVLGVGLLAQREEHALLALATVEVRRAVARPGVLERLGPVHVLDPGRDVQPVELAPLAREAIVGDRDLDVDGHATDRVDDLLEAFEVDLDEVLDVEVVQLAEDRLERVVAARPVVAGPQVRAVTVVGEEAVDLAAVVAAPDLARRSLRDRHVDRVARQAEHRDLLGDRVDRDHDERVGVVAAALLVGADQQDVQAFLAVPRGDRHVRHGRPDQGRVRGGGVGRLLGRLIGAGGRRRGGRAGFVRAVLGRVLPDEDAVAAAVDEVHRECVIAGDDDMAGGHDQQDGQQAGDRQRAAPQACPAGAAIAGGRLGIHELGDPIRVDDRHDPVDEDHQVEDEHAGQDGSDRRPVRAARCGPSGGRRRPAVRSPGWARRRRRAPVWSPRHTTARDPGTAGTGTPR